MFKKYKEHLDYFLDNKYYVMPLIIIALMCYGFAAANSTISVDDMEADKYVGSEHIMLRAGRFGMVFWTKLFGYNTAGVYTSCAVQIIAVVMFLWAAINFCILFRKISHDSFPMPVYIIFSCALVSYPLINEVWEYTGLGLNAYICGGYLLVSFVLFFTNKQIHSGFNLPLTLASVFAMTIICSTYESIIIVYIFTVFAVLALQIIFDGEKSLVSIIRQGLCYAGVLAAGLAARVLVHISILFLFDLEYKRNGATHIYWLELPFVEVVKNLIKSTLADYVLKGLIYFPITEFVLCIILSIVIGLVFLKKGKNMALLLPWAGMLGTLFLLSIIQGEATLYRNNQVSAVFVAFTFMLLAYLFYSGSGKCLHILYPCLISGLGLLCIWQAVYLNRFLTVNHLRSEEEAAVIRDISRTLEADFDTEKPVIFTGDYRLSDSLIEAVSIPESSWRWHLYQKLFPLLKYEGECTRKLPDSNVNSIIEFSTTAFNSEESMHRLFSFYGYDYVYDNDTYIDTWLLASQYLKENPIPAYPEDGCIVDCGDYIIVNLK